MSDVEHCEITITNDSHSIVISNGIYVIGLYDQNKHHTINIDLVDKLKEVVKRELSSRRHFSSIFHLAVNGKEEDFLNHPDHIIMNFLDEKETKPTTKLTNEELSKFYIKKLLNAYNKWQGTSLKYRDVETLCRSRVT